MRDDARRHPPIPFQHEGRPLPGRIEHADRIQRLSLDASALARKLAREVRGEVRFDDGSRALYATDASNYRQVPIGVVIPRDADDVIATVALAREFGAPILGRGAGTSLAGQCCNVAVVLDFSKYMNAVVDLDPVAGFARVQPGIVLDDLRDAAEKHRLTFGPDPATHSRCTIGGMIGNNSCGVHALMAGKTVDNIDELEILTYDGLRMRVGATSDGELESIIREGGRRGEIYANLRALRDRHAQEIRARYPKIPRRVSGYNLDSLLPEEGFNVARALVGSECTCAIVLEAKCRLVYSPPARALAVLGYEDIYVAADDVPRLLEFEPIGLEGVDDRLIEHMKAKGLNADSLGLLPEGRGWLLVEFGGDSVGEAEAKVERMFDALRRSSLLPSMKLYHEAWQARMIWKIRESGLGATAYVPGQPRTWEGWEDSAVDPRHLGRYLRELRALMDKYGYIGDLYGHFGQACVHTRNNFDFESHEGVAKYRAYVHEAADLCIKYNGSLSGEHGDGQSRAELLPKMFGETLVEAFREFKSIWDPAWKMNPGKVVTPYLASENLRHGPDHKPWVPQTHFSFREDEGRFDRAVLRCVGVGACRQLDTGTMCPSFMATREEEHSTRGRAHLLFEMFTGETVPASWRNEAVKDSLDLCLACKACKSECPVGVDMATYKAEFLSHYYEGRLRPPGAYAMGWIHRWSRFAELAPGLANLAMAFPVTKHLAGIAPSRAMPRYASETFVSEFRRRRARHHDSGEPHGRVVLWPDTFNNHFSPETATAAVEVLEAAGFHVTIPSQRLCCGRPLYDWGFLDMARRQLATILDALEPEIDGGLPIVGLEPSCVSVFRDELPALFPHDPRARKLASLVVTLGEFVDVHAAQFRFPQLVRKALVQPHCHHASIMKFGSEERVLKRIGLEVETPDAGCCGMAGAFGFDEENVAISRRVGERVLLPKVRSAADETLIVANGFSCREQIAQETERRALHLSQVLQMAMREGSSVPRPLPEEAYVLERPLFPVSRRMAGIAAGVALFAAGVALMRRGRGRSERENKVEGRASARPD